jgi:hypothetical protein
MRNSDWSPTQASIIDHLPRPGWRRALSQERIEHLFLVALHCAWPDVARILLPEIRPEKLYKICHTIPRFEILLVVDDLTPCFQAMVDGGAHDLREMSMVCFRRLVTCIELPEFTLLTKEQFDLLVREFPDDARRMSLCPWRTRSQGEVRGSDEQMITGPFTLTMANAHLLTREMYDRHISREMGRAMRDVTNWHTEPQHGRRSGQGFESHATTADVRSIIRDFIMFMRCDVIDHILATNCRPGPTWVMACRTQFADDVRILVRVRRVMGLPDILPWRDDGHPDLRAIEGREAEFVKSISGEWDACVAAASRQVIPDDLLRMWHAAGGSTRILFSGTTGPHGFFTNFARCSFTLGGHTWATSEHYFQAMKFHPHDPDSVNLISLVRTPKEAATQGRSRLRALRPDWEAVKTEVMLMALTAKFAQNANARNALLATGDAMLVEHSVRDRFWGDGGNGSGQNILGLLLMRVRHTLRA